MLNDYQISTIGEAWIAVIYLLFVSGLYWHSSKSYIRSIHGVMMLLGFSYAVAISAYTEFGPANYYYWPLHIALLIGLVSIVFSFKAFQTNKLVHVLHVLTIISGGWVWLIGSMAISHDWL